MGLLAYFAPPRRGSCREVTEGVPSALFRQLRAEDPLCPRVRPGAGFWHFPPQGERLNLRAEHRSAVGVTLEGR